MARAGGPAVARCRRAGSAEQGGGAGRASAWSKAAARSKITSWCRTVGRRRDAEQGGDTEQGGGVVTRPHRAGGAAALCRDVGCWGRVDQLSELSP